MSRHVLIDARLIDGRAGGIQQVIVGLAQGLSVVDLGKERVTFLMFEGHTAWLEPFVGKGGQGLDIATVPAPKVRAASTGVLRKLKAWSSGVSHLLGPGSIRVPTEPAIVEKLAPDIVHFVHQVAFKTSRPFIYTPHDLQHEYFPEHFSRRVVMARRYLYRWYCERAVRVVCISGACRDDLMEYIGLPEDKLAVIYNAPPTTGYDKPDEIQLQETREIFNLPEIFMYFPAKTYPHKNHLNLVKAVAILKDRGQTVHVVCSGPTTDFFHSSIQPAIRQAGVEDQFNFLGWIDTLQVNALYALATALVFPSQFEGFGLPLVEAMAAGLPIVCSNTSCVPEIVADAAVLFDPDQPDEIAGAIHKIMTNTDTRAMLKERGLKRANDFTWSTSAEKYLELYRSI